MTTDGKSPSLAQTLAALSGKSSALAEALGHTISRWANVEYGIVAIFATATGMSGKIAASILRQVKTFSLLLDMCNAAVQCRLEGRDELIYWNSIVEYARELSGDRNYMAHHAMILHSPGPPETMPAEMVEPKIGPNILAAMAGADDKRQPLDKAELAALLEDFQQLNAALADFNDALGNGRTSQDKYLAPIARRRPPRKQRLEALRQEQGSPPSASQG